jgi:hypothetical protein
MKRIYIIMLLGITIFITSCAKIYYSPDAYTVAQKHKKIAIIPPKVSIAAKKKVDAEAIKEQQKTESINFQNEIYSWLLKRKMQRKINVELQEVETTNAKLAKANYPEEPLSPGELCKLLGVDGILMSNFGLSKPMSEGGAIAMTLLVGAGGATNEVNVSISIHDGGDDKLIWNYDHKFSGGLGSSPSSMVDVIMRKASKKMPYMNNF